MSSASQTDICNRALQMLGAQLLTSLSENSKNARACNTAYDACRRRELRLNDWNFSIKRVQLAASSTSPLFGRGNAYPIPGDFLKLLPSDPIDFSNYSTTVSRGGTAFSVFRDWKIEAGNIITNDAAPLNVRYTYDCQDTSLFDSMFCEALSARVALALSETITQSNMKAQVVAAIYKESIAEARLANALENPPASSTDDVFVTCRI